MKATETASSAAAPGAEAPKNYEEAVAELETLVERMEGGALSLEDSLAAYRRGASLVAFCQRQLEQVEAQVKVLDEGELVDLEDARMRPAGGGDA